MTEQELAERFGLTPIYAVDKIDQLDFVCVPWSEVIPVLQRFEDFEHEEVTTEIVHHVLWFYGEPEGWEPGSFTKNLMRAIGPADPYNTAKLRLVFPAYVAAMRDLDIDELRLIIRNERSL
jgi:hypothetical protein